MFSRGEIARSLQGAWLLLCNRQDGLQWFDRSVEGFWRSFGVFFLLLPMYGIIFLAEKTYYIQETELLVDRSPENAYWFAVTVAVSLNWIALPIVLALIAGSIGIAGGYVGLIVARNWSSLLVTLPQAATALLYLLGILPAGLMLLSWLIVFVVAIWYFFNIVRFSLASPISVTLGIVFLDVVLSLFIGKMSEGLWAG